MKRFLSILFIITIALSVIPFSASAKGNGNKSIHINVVLNTEITDALLAELGEYGKVGVVFEEINALTMQIRAKDLSAVQSLPFVEAANPDRERYAPPIDTVEVEDFANGLSTWNLDAVNVTNPGFDNRTLEYDGDGVYVAVLDTGLMDTWRQYFPQERIAEEYAVSFSGGGQNRGAVSTQPNKWEHATHPHGTHVASTIIGYSFNGTPFNGVAPKATVIPVKVLHQGQGFGWSSMIAAGIVHVAELKAGPLADSPVVINMSLGGPELDAVEKAAIDYAIAQGVIIVASAGNEGESGMGYPGAYEPVISAAASGWVGEWTVGPWWYALDVADPTDPDDFYITSFSSRELSGQDLDVAAPGSWVVGPWQLQMGKTSYYFVGGTSMASPHVAGIAALMAQKDGSLTGPAVEDHLEAAAIELPPGCRTVAVPFPPYSAEYCWGADATGSGLITADKALGEMP